MNINIIKLKKKISHFLDKKKHTLIKNLINLSKVYNSKKLTLGFVKLLPRFRIFLIMVPTTNS